MVVEHYMHPPVHGEHLDIVLPSRYENLRKVGSGATSIVYRAHDRFLDLPVAIKCLKSHHTDYHHVRRFQKEAKLMSSLSFANLPRVFDFGLSQDGHPYMVMELVVGHSLRSMLARRGAFSVSASLSIFLQICSALAYAHSHGITHRDLKAGNIMVTWNTKGEPVVKLVDFGLASTSNQEPDESGVAVGTPLYMSPEQAMGRQTDARSDIYSFGCLMFETLTGHPPIKGDSAAETLAMHIGTRAPLLSKHLHMHSQSLQEMEIVIAVALEKEPADRYQSIDELAQALLAVAACERGFTVEGLFGTGNQRRLNDGSYAADNIDTGSGAKVEVGHGASVSETFKVNLQEIAKTAPLGRMNMSANGLAAGKGGAAGDISLLIPEAFDCDSELVQTLNDLGSPVSNLVNSHEALAACLEAKFQNSRRADILSREHGANQIARWSKLLDVRIVSILTILILGALLVCCIVNSISVDELKEIRTEKPTAPQEQLNRLLRHEMIVSGTKVWCMPETTVRELEQFRIHNNDVTYLGLCATQTDGEGLDFIGDWPIDTIDARGLKLSEKGFAAIAGVKTLSRLRLDAARELTGAKMTKLHGLPKLNELVLNCCILNDSTVEAIANMKGIEVLHVDHTDLNGDKLAKFAKMKSLKLLTIDGCYAVSDSAIRAFRAARPDVELTI